jgi:O-antigen/teichoic acid export membrane protein
MAIVAVVTPLAALSYPIAIVLPKEDIDARGIAKLSAYIAVCIAALVLLLFLVAGNWLVELLHVQEISAFILLIPLVIVFSALMQIAQQWLIRKKQFQITARAAVFHALIINSLKSGIGLFKPLAAVLISLAAIGNAIHAGLLAWGAKKYERDYQKQNKATHDWASLWTLAKKHYDFPLFRAPQNFINSISQNLPVLMLAAFFGPAAAGFYALCRRLLGLPSQLISKSVGDVFYPRITEAAHRGENLTRLIIKATFSLAAVGFIPFAVIVAFGPWLFGFVFGSEWVMAGEYARWLALMMFFFFINKPAVVAVPVLDLQKGLLFYEVFSTGSKLLAMYIGFIIFQNDIIVVALFGVFGAIAYITLISWVIFSSFALEKRRQHV